MRDEEYNFCNKIVILNTRVFSCLWHTTFYLIMLLVARKCEEQWECSMCKIGELSLFTSFSSVNTEEVDMSRGVWDCLWSDYCKNKTWSLCRICSNFIKVTGGPKFFIMSAFQRVALETKTRSAFVFIHSRPVVPALECRPRHFLHPNGTPNLPTSF